VAGLHGLGPVVMVEVLLLGSAQIRSPVMPNTQQTTAIKRIKITFTFLFRNQNSY